MWKLMSDSESGTLKIPHDTVFSMICAFIDDLAWFMVSPWIRDSSDVKTNVRFRIRDLQNPPWQTFKHDLWSQCWVWVTHDSNFETLNQGLKMHESMSTSRAWIRVPPWTSVWNFSMIWAFLHVRTNRQTDKQTNKQTWCVIMSPRAEARAKKWVQLAICC